MIFPDRLPTSFAQAADWVGVRFVSEKTSTRGVRDGRPDRNATFVDEGAMVEVLVDGHFGFAATADFSTSGLERALRRALEGTKAAAARRIFSFTPEARPPIQRRTTSHSRQPLDRASVAELTSVLVAASEAMKISDRIASRVALALLVQTETHLLSTSGTHATANTDLVTLHLAATAAEGSEMQTRTLHGAFSECAQAGAEFFERDRCVEQARDIAREALELLAAENCPEGRRDLLIMPDQMSIQIHESIGHPLELDRILGDERNYAGWSFVRPEDFGHLRYGSKLLNVTFDPHRRGEFASYDFDDGGLAATKQALIRDGILLRGLGAAESQARLKLPGVANSRASSWNRAPIDRMANINVEPGHTSVEEMVRATERGILVRSNRSWSIDDERNKFQFGCEHGRLIENGRLTRVVKNPNYRGQTIDFWNRLEAVGPAEDSRSYGIPFCGKGEPNQSIRVGHAAPPCLFTEVEVFGGAS